MNGGFVDFTSTRLLTPPSGQTESFIVPLGEAINMVWAYSTYSAASGDSGLAYHGTAKGYWSLTIDENGRVTSAGNTGGVSVSAKPYRIHGWLMWSSWSILSLI